MLTGVVRPWGLFPWVFSKLNRKKWSFLGCISVEERGLGILYYSASIDTLGSHYFLEIVDGCSEYSEEAEKKRKTNREKAHKIIGNFSNLGKPDLLVSPKKIKGMIDQYIKSISGSVILDISVLPKRFFFPIVKILMGSDEISDIVVTYTVPAEYHKGELAEDPLSWDFIPMFQRTNHPPPRTEIVIVGVGFLPFGLPDLLKTDYQEVDVNLIFPFPPGPPNYQRTWDFVREIERSYKIRDSKKIIRVDALDAPNCYRHISALTDNGKNPAIFAPYGPKPHSLAMCLHAIEYDCDVYYTQPRIYHPNYTEGIRRVNGNPETYAYCLKLDGNNFYKAEDQI